MSKSIFASQILTFMKQLVYSLIACLFMVACSSNENSETEGPKAFDVGFIDSTVDPCNNFYQYAIGAWRKDNPVPETESRWMAFNILYEENRQKLLAIVDEVSQNTYAKKGSDKQMIRDFYNTGIDSLAREKNGLSSIESILNEISLAERKEDIIHLFGELAPLSIKTPIGMYVGSDSKNSNKNVVHASQSGLNLPDKDYYLEESEKFQTIRSKYVDHINKMFEIAGIESSPGEQILELEKDIAEISWSRLERRDPNKSYNKRNFVQWDASLMSLDLQQIVSTRGFKDFDTLIVSQPSFFEKLDDLFASSTVEDWKAYLQWNTINSFSSYLTSALEKENFNFYGKVLNGTSKMKPRKELVYTAVNGMLGEPLGKLFVENHFSEDSKEYMVRMIENLRSAYKERIHQLTWMSDETKEKALKKLASFTYKVGYPDKWEDYSSLNIEDKDFAINVLNARKFYYQKMLDKQNEPVDKEEWHMTPQTVNAYYSSSNNEIVFPAGILQPPFFHKEFDDAINYGGIGAVIGHEFSHGFDDQGSKFDWDGNLNEWWTAEDRAKFEALAKKLGQQYSSYSPIDGMYVNGELTMGENIADLGGITLAYAALEKELEGKDLGEIDGFTWQQRFFLGWANVWKGNIKEEEVMKRLKSDPHSPAEYRVIGPLVNFKPFDDAWGGCLNKPMYKADSAKIVIW